MTAGGMDAESSANGLLVNIEPPPVARILRGGGKVKPKKGLCGYRKNFEAHRGQIAERPGGRRGEPGDGAGIDQPGPASLDVRHLLGAQRGSQRVGADQVAAMDDGLRTFGCRVPYRALERLGAIVTVRDDADLHAADHSPRPSIAEICITRRFPGSS